MSELIHNGVRYGRARFNFKLTTPKGALYPPKLMFYPEKSVKGTAYYFEPFTILLSEIYKAPNLGKIIDERLAKEKL